MTAGRLAGRTVLVVGASSGIGRALAAASVGAGADTVLVARRRPQLDEAVAEAGGGRAVVADITRPGEAARLVEEALAVDASLDLVVLAAGAGVLARMADAPEGQWADLMATNVIALNQVIRAALPRMSTGGIVAALSSETVGRPRRGLGLYGASKAALDQSLLSWQEEHPERRFCRVTVGATMPTGFGDGFEPGLLGESMTHWVRSGEMQQRFMRADEVSQVLLGLLASALDHPSVNVEHLRLRSPSARVAALEDIEFE